VPQGKGHQHTVECIAGGGQLGHAVVLARSVGFYCWGSGGVAVGWLVALVSCAKAVCVALLRWLYCIADITVSRDYGGCSALLGLLLQGMWGLQRSVGGAAAGNVGAAAL
jgi:hypothetical protein